MARVRIYQQGKSSMQSGRARAGSWMLKHEPAEAQRPDPLTGWAGSGDTSGQLRLSFPSLEAATAYATREGLEFHVVAAADKAFRVKTYAENFR